MEPPDLDDLPRAYRIGLRLRELGADDDLIGECLGIDPAGVSTLIEIGRRKLATEQGLTQQITLAFSQWQLEWPTGYTPRSAPQRAKPQRETGRSPRSTAAFPECCTHQSCTIDETKAAGQVRAITPLGDCATWSAVEPGLNAKG